jgi:hypothetical protein
MNSIHTLLSENHPCTLFMVSLLPATMLHRTKHIITSTVDDGVAPYSYLRQRQDWNNPLHHQHNPEFSEVVINHVTARMLGLTVPPTLLSTACSHSGYGAVARGYGPPLAGSSLAARSIRQFRRSSLESELVVRRKTRSQVSDLGPSCLCDVWLPLLQEKPRLLAGCEGAGLKESYLQETFCGRLFRDEANSRRGDWFQ